MKLTEFPVTITVNGIPFTAKRVVSGQRILRQQIEFRGHVEPDSTAYAPGENKIMESWAELILWQ